MSTLPQARSTAGPAIFGEAPPGAALVLAAFDIAAATWLLCVGVGLHRSTAEDAGQGTAHADFWFGLLTITVPLVLFLLLISVASLVKVPVRSEPRIFRVLLAGTGVLSLVIAAPFALAYLSPLF